MRRRISAKAFIVGFVLAFVLTGYISVARSAGDAWWGFDTLKRFLAGDHTWTGTQTFTKSVAMPTSYSGISVYTIGAAATNPSVTIDWSKGTSVVDYTAGAITANTGVSIVTTGYPTLTDQVVRHTLIFKQATAGNYGAVSWPGQTEHESGVTTAPSTVLGTKSYYVLEYRAGTTPTVLPGSQGVK